MLGSNLIDLLAGTCGVVGSVLVLMSFFQIDWAAVRTQGRGPLARTVMKSKKGWRQFWIGLGVFAVWSLYQFSS